MADDEKLEFVDCTSLSISYDIMGLATVSFAIYANTPGVKVRNSIAGFEGYVTNVNTIPMINVPKWYVSTVTLLATKYSK